MRNDYCVCVPARNEADRIAVLIDALAAQDVPGQIPLALCVNNSDDGTADRARAASHAHQGRIALCLHECSFPDRLAHVGSARRAAMEMGRGLLATGDGQLITTDADCRPPVKWISANLEWAASDRIVGGRIAIDEDDADCSSEILALRDRYDLYWDQVRTIEDAIDPRPWDENPRHGDHSGASLMMSLALYDRSGGVPLLACREDQALVEAAVAAGGRLVHPLAVWTRASPRRAGRASGGMAEEMARWAAADDIRCSPFVPDFRHWRNRAAWRRARRDAGEADVARAERALPAMPCDMPLPMAAPA